MLLRMTVLTLLIGLNINTAGAVDYEKVQQELYVMADLMKRSINKSKDCKGCSVNIKNHYLANQGAVFYLAAPGIFQFASFSGGENIVRPSPSMRAIHPVKEILIDVNETLSDISMEMGDGSHGAAWSWFGDDFIGNIHFSGGDEEQQEKIIDLRRERRKLKRERAKLKMKAAEEELERQGIKFDEEIERLGVALKTIEDKYASAMEEQEKSIKAAHAKRQARQEAKAKKRQERNELIKRLVMTSLCEYQATLRNLPENEHVSLVFEGMPDSESTHIYVFDKSKLSECESASDKASTFALEYMI